jgi:hypothetical protein
MIRIRGISSAADEVHRRRFVSRQSQQIHRLIPTPCPMTSSMHKHEMRRLRHPHNNNFFLSFLFFFFCFLVSPSLPATRFDLHQLQNTSVNKPTKTKEHKKLKVPETNKILELLMTLNLWIESPTLPPPPQLLLSSLSVSLTPNCGFLSVSSLSSLSPSPNCGFLSP